MKLALDRVIKHNLEMAKTGTGLEAPNDIRETIEDQLIAFSKEVYETRKGSLQDNHGNKIPPYDVSLNEALQYKFGFKDLKQFLRALDIRTGSYNIHDTARRFGLDHLTERGMVQLMTEHSSFGNPMNTTDISTEFRFIIPEIFAAAIRTGYQHSALHNNWIGSTLNLAQQKITMPLILRGDGMPSRVNEGANIPTGSIKFGKKDVSLFKIGTGFAITDELLMASNLDLLFIFLQEVGNDMAIGADSTAFNVLLNGEQADLSESAPEVGVINTTNGFTFKDTKRVFTRGTRLGIPYNRMVTGEDDGIDITSIDRFEGFNGQTRLASIRSIVGVPEKFDMDTYLLPANKILYMNSDRAMVKLQYRGMMSEELRNPQNQTNNIFISDWINFAIVKRDARVLQNKSVTYGAVPFPAYMDVDARINASYAAL